MTVHHCDCCGKKCDRYIQVSLSIKAENYFTNVADLMSRFGGRTYEWCPECADMVLSKYRYSLDKEENKND